jgi:hypothetical protein
MGAERGKQKGPTRSGAGAREARSADEGGRLSPLPELVRRALSLGLSGFFLTEEAVRRALGDTLPKDWIDFAFEQSERTRSEFLERLSFEMARAFEKADLTAVLRELLEGRTLELRAEIRLRGRDEGGGGDVSVASTVKRRRE